MATAQSDIQAESSWTGLGNWDWRHWAFYVGVPALFATYGALNNWVALEAAGYLGAIAFYVAHAFVPWWTTCLCTQAAMTLLKRWQPSQWILLLIGTLAGCVLILPYSNWITGYFERQWMSDSAAQQQIENVSTFFRYDFLSYTLRASIVWFVVNWLFDRYLGLPRYRYKTIARSSPAAAIATPGVPVTPVATPADKPPPRFLARMDEPVTMDDVVALKAEQHYIGVYTKDSRQLVLYRFSDAVDEMPEDVGLQVHRSYWVKKSAITSLQRGGKKSQLKLECGLIVPVSGPYRALVQQFAKSEGIAITPLL